MQIEPASPAARLYLAVAVSIMIHAAALVAVARLVAQTPSQWRPYSPLELRLTHPAAAIAHEPARAGPAHESVAHGPSGARPEATRSSAARTAPIPDIPAAAVVPEAPPQAAAAAPAAAAATPIARTVSDEAVSSPDFSAAYLDNPPPVYPLVARRLGIEGEVRLKVRVSSGGDPLSVEIAKSSGHDSLDSAAMTAVGKWKFVPARRGAQAIEAWVLVPVKFRLAND